MEAHTGLFDLLVGGLCEIGAIMACREAVTIGGKIAIGRLSLLRALIHNLDRAGVMDGGVMDCFFGGRGDVATFSDMPKEPIPQVHRHLLLFVPLRFYHTCSRLFDLHQNFSRRLGRYLAHGNYAS